MTEPITDAEVIAMNQLYALLKPHGEHARRRMFDWANARLLTEKRAAAKAAPRSPSPFEYGAALLLNDSTPPDPNDEP